MMADALFVIEHSAGPAWADGVPFREQPGIGVHIEFMRSLEARGALVLGGPFLDGAGDVSVGMAIVRADSLGTAEALAAGDPSVARGLLRYRVRPWLAPMGSAISRG